MLDEPAIHRIALSIEGDPVIDAPSDMTVRHSLIVIGRRADYPERSVGELLLYVNKSKSA